MTAPGKFGLAAPEPSGLPLSPGRMKMEESCPHGQLSVLALLCSVLGPCPVMHGMNGKISRLFLQIRLI